MANEEKKEYTLKNGQRIEGGEGIAFLRALQSLLSQDPQLFRALLAIVQGRPQNANSEAIANLKHGGYLRADNGTVPVGLSDVLISAYHESQEGPVLVNPFRFISPEEAREVEQTEEASIDWLIRELHKSGGKDRPTAKE